MFFSFGFNIQVPSLLPSLRMRCNFFSGYSKQKLGEGEATPFPSTDFGWSPVNDKSVNDADDAEASFDRTGGGGARKKLGFEGLFDQTDPNPENFDDVVGLCSGQFVTQQPLLDDDDDGGVDALSATQEATPDTVVMTKELTQSATLTVTLAAKDKKEAEEEKDTQDTVMLSDDEAEVERAPGLFEEYPGFLDSSDSDGEMPSLVVFSSTWNYLVLLTYSILAHSLTSIS